MDKATVIAEIAERFDIATRGRHVIFNAYDAPTELAAMRLRSADCIDMLCDAMQPDETIQFYNCTEYATLTKMSGCEFIFTLTDM